MEQTYILYYTGIYFEGHYSSLYIGLTFIRANITGTHFRKSSQQF